MSAGPSELVLREHNQHDTAAESGRYDVACLTERSHHISHAHERYATRLKGLAIDWDPDVIDVHGKHFRVAHPPIPGRSPMRGTLWITGVHKPSGQRVAVMCAHRINDASGAAVRPRRRLAVAYWSRHARLDARIAKRLTKRGYLVFYGGDINNRDANLTPLFRASATRGNYDAIGFPDDPAVRLSACDVGVRGGSDHRAFTAVFNIRPKV